MRLADLHPPARALVALAAILPLAACADDTIARGREDSGVAARDGGSTGPLQLEAGMTFTYRGILTRRDQAQGTEQNSQYTLTLTIDSVDDNGAASESTVTFHASDPSTTADQWMAPYDFDSWVGRLGPSLRDDVVSTTPVTAMLSQIPTIPPAPTPAKALPQPGTFFFDVRQIDAFRAAFSEHYASQSPQVTEPASGGGKWRFAFSGPAPTSGNEQVVFYPAKTRQVMLSYDPRGFLTNLDETIGDINMRPSASCRIELTSGP